MRQIMQVFCDMYKFPMERLNRKNYFIKTMIYGALIFIWLGLFTYLDGFLSTPTILTLKIICIIFMASALLKCLALDIQRLHDLNHSGWFVMLAFIPYIRYLFALYLLIVKGTDADNNYQKCKEVDDFQ